MSGALRALAAAFGYFSILPSRARSAPNPAAFALLPIVGVVLGVLAASIGLLGARVLHGEWRIALALVAMLVLTGALHLDGYLDCADAICASVPPERRRAILRDPHHGSYALAALAILIVLWLAALAGIPSARFVVALAFAAGAARLAVLPLAWIFPAATASTAGAIAGTPAPLLAALSLAIVVAIGWLVAPLVPLALLPLAVVALGGAAVARRRLGAVSGDVYGALICILEVGALALVPLLLRG